MSSLLGFWPMTLGDSLYSLRKHRKRDGRVLGFFSLGEVGDNLWMEIMNLFWCMLNKKCL